MTNATMASDGIIELSNNTKNKRLKIIMEYSNNISTKIENNNSYFRLLFLNPETDRLERKDDNDTVISKNISLYFKFQTNQDIHYFLFIQVMGSL
jgi:hypothetical protein